MYSSLGWGGGEIEIGREQPLSHFSLGYIYEVWVVSHKSMTISRILT